MLEDDEIDNVCMDEDLISFLDSIYKYKYTYSFHPLAFSSSVAQHHYSILIDRLIKKQVDPKIAIKILDRIQLLDSDDED